jgi:hypothetical protein
MKILFSIFLLCLLSGCYIIPCEYCHEKKHPDYVKRIDKDMGDGITKEIKWYGWVHYSKRIPQPDKNIEVFEGKE